MTMTIKKSNQERWTDSTGAKIEIVPDYIDAERLRIDAEAKLLTEKPGSFEYENALDTLRQLWAQDLIDCDHSYTETVEVDDTRWLEPDGVHSRSNADQTKCLICGSTYIESEDRWEQL